MTNRAGLLPGRIPPQTVPLVTKLPGGQLVVDINWYLYFYNLGQQVLAGATGDVNYTPADLIAIQDDDVVSTDTAAFSRQIANALLQLPEQEVAPAQRDVTNALLLALSDQFPAPVPAPAAPIFRAHSTASTTTGVVNTPVKVLFQAVDVDSGGYFASSRFTPKVPGWYQISANVTTLANPAYWTCGIWKNGAQYDFGNISGAGASAGAWVNVSDLVFLNGSTDFIEIWVQAGTASVATQGLPITDYFTGHWVHA